MIIANPIYDVVFKRMMENDKVAKFFIGTLIEENIESLELKPQEYTFKGEVDYDDPKVLNAIEERMRERYSIWVYRLDFVATIKLEDGSYKKVLIEIQKARNQIDLMRFRNYLAEQYKKEDRVNNHKIVLPITTIYILGFKLSEIDSACIKVERNYRDLVSRKIIDKKSDFVEKLTHDSFIVQVERITDRYQTKLDKLLSVFEQTNFTDNSHIIKQYNHNADVEEVKIMTNILHHTGTDPNEKKRIENEQEAWRTINAMFEEKENEFQKTLNDKDKTIIEKDKAITEKDKAITEKDKIIEELMKKLNEK